MSVNRLYSSHRPFKSITEAGGGARSARVTPEIGSFMPLKVSSFEQSARLAQRKVEPLSSKKISFVNQEDFKSATLRLPMSNVTTSLGRPVLRGTLNPYASRSP